MAKTVGRVSNEYKHGRERPRKPGGILAGKARTKWGRSRPLNGFCHVEFACWSHSFSVQFQRVRRHSGSSERGANFGAMISRNGSTPSGGIVLGKAFKDVIGIGKNAGRKQPALLSFRSPQDLV